MTDQPRGGQSRLTRLLDAVTHSGPGYDTEPAHDCTTAEHTSLITRAEQAEQRERELRARLKDAEEGITAAIRQRKEAETRAEAASRLGTRYMTAAEQAEAELRRYTEAESADAAAGSYAGRAERAEQRLRLAHQARRAKEHQLDGIRRALCDIGAMRDDDPYSHADLEDVIRQAGRLDELSAAVAAELDGDAEEADRQLSREEEIRGVQAWMALDVHQALGWSLNGGGKHQGRKSWSDWWAELCAEVRQLARQLDAYRAAEAYRQAQADTFAGRLDALKQQTSEGLVTGFEQLQQRAEQAEAAIARVRRIPRLPHHSQQTGELGRAYTRGWESVIDTIDEALSDTRLGANDSQACPYCPAAPQFLRSELGAHIQEKHARVVAVLASGASLDDFLAEAETRTALPHEMEA